MSDYWLNFFFVYYPYICLTVMLSGLCFRYLGAPGGWNSRSTELLEKKLLRLGAPLFHCGVILALVGHVAGLLLPGSFWDWALGSADLHDSIAMFVGRFLVVFMLVGLGVLLARRLFFARVRAASEVSDYVIVLLLFVNVFTGLYTLYYLDIPLFFPMGTWLRGLLSFQPDPVYMTSVPPYMQLHVISAFTIFALVPFSRLVHILSAPLTYALRPLIVFRRRWAGLP